MYKLLLAPLTIILLAAPVVAVAADNTAAYQFLEDLVEPHKGLGAREAGTKKEGDTAKYLAHQFKKMGLEAKIQSFQFGKARKSSVNIIVDTQPNANKTIVLAAHYDSTAAAQGSMGATDNGAGVAAMLAIAQNVVTQATDKDTNIRFIAFGAEETGLAGSKYYVKQLLQSPKELRKIVAMINFDTIAGGDITYVHSAHTKPYRCASKKIPFNSDAKIRDAMLKASIDTLGDEDKYTVHPAYPGYPEGVTGAWSDHAPFACAGIPIAYVESTNFAINGEEGFDGYSQTTHKNTWSCFDSKTKTACDRSAEKQWGKIWHTKFDTLSTMNTLFPGRVAKQLEQNVKVVTHLLLNSHHYLNN